MKKIITFILFALLLLPLEGQIGRYPFYTATVADTLGPEMISNGTFTDGSDWSPGTGWTISGGVATYDDVTDYAKLMQLDADMLESVKEYTKYKLVFTLTISTGEGSFYITDSSVSVIYKARTGYANGTHTLYFTTGDWISVKGICFQARTTSDASYTLSNISLKEVY